jgi:hypothetical protein
MTTEETCDRIEDAYELIEGKPIGSVWRLAEANLVSDALKAALQEIVILENSRAILKGVIDKFVNKDGAK